MNAFKHKGGGYRTPDATRSGQDGNENELTRSGPEAHARIDLAYQHGNQCARRACKSTRGCIFELDESLGRISEVVHAHLVLPDCRAHMAQRGTQVTRNTPGREQRGDRRQQVDRLHGAHARHLLAEKRGTCDRKAIGGAKALGFEQHTVEDHRQRHRQHREKDAAVAPHQKAGAKSNHARDDRSQYQQGQRVAQAQPGLGQSGHVAAQAVVKRMAKGHQAGSQQKQHSQCDKALGQRDSGGAHQPGGHEERTGDQQHQQQAQCCIGSKKRPHIFLRADCGNKPSGRTASTRAITA